MINRCLTISAKSIHSSRKQTLVFSRQVATTGLANDDEVFVDSIGGMTELNGRNYRVANSTTNTFTLTDLFGNAMDTTNFTTYTSGGTATEDIQKASTPYAEADLFDIRFVQSADTMYLVHPSYDIRTLTRTDHNAWTFATFSITGSPSPGLNGANNRPSVVSFLSNAWCLAIQTITHRHCGFLRTEITTTLLSVRAMMMR